MDAKQLHGEIEARKEMLLRLPSQRQPDAFDSLDFDPIKFVNTIYPDETSLTDIDRFVGVLQKQASVA